MIGAQVKNIRRTGIPASKGGKPNPGYAEFMLTNKQQSVCDMVVQGLSNKEIAERSGVVVRTVESHRLEIYRRAGVRNAVELVRKVLGIST